MAGLSSVAAHSESLEKIESVIRLFVPILKRAAASRPPGSSRKPPHHTVHSGTPCRRQAVASRSLPSSGSARARLADERTLIFQIWELVNWCKISTRFSSLRNCQLEIWTLKIGLGFLRQVGFLQLYAEPAKMQQNFEFCIASFHKIMHPPLTLHRHPMCAEIIEEFTRCHSEHPIGKFFGDCTQLKIKLDRCFRQEKAIKRKANFEESKKLRERLQALRKEEAETNPVHSA